MTSRRRIALCAVVSVFALTVLGNLGTTTSAMHLPGRRAGSITDIATPMADSSGSVALVKSWADWDASHDRTAPSRASAAPVLASWLVVDSLAFAPSLALLLSLSSRRRRFFVPDTSWLKPLLEAGPAVALVYLALDELENASTALLIFQSSHHTLLAWAVRVVSGLKLGAFLGAGLLIVLSFIPRIRRAGATDVVLTPAQRWPSQSVLALRVPLAVVVLTALVMIELPTSVRPQLADMVRAWASVPRLWTGVFAFAAVVALSVGLWAATALLRDRSARSAAPRQLGPTPPATSLAYLGAAIVVGLAAWAFQSVVGWYLGASVALGLALFGLLSAPAPVRVATEPRDGQGINDGLVRSLVTTPALAFTLMVLASIDFAGPFKEIGVLALYAVVGLGLAVVAWRASRLAPAFTNARLVLLVLGVSAFGLATFGWTHPLGTGWTLGSVATLVVGILALLGMLSAAEHVFWRPPRAALARIRVTRAPILTSVVVLFGLTSILDTSVALHSVRVLPHADQGPSATDALPFESTDLVSAYHSQATVQPNDESAISPDVQPVVVIAASGGGGRAQYWTLDVLNCLFGGQKPGGTDGRYDGCNETAPWNNVLAASGVSGGSIGLAMFAAEAAHQRGTVDVQEMFKKGFLDPLMASMIFTELPNSLLRMPTEDRAVALERAFESALPSMTDPFFGTQLESQNRKLEPRFPVLMLNSAAVDDGCRINVSVLRLAETPKNVTRQGEAEPVDASCRTVLDAETGADTAGRPLFGTRDVADFLCDDNHDGRDLRMSTAALLSARFPLISPTGALTGCNKLRKNDVHTFAGDGGYVDASASSPLVELLNGLIRHSTVTAPPGASSKPWPCIQPVVIQVDNSYETLSQPSGPGRPQELQAPLAGAGAANSGHTDASLQALAELAAGPRCPQLAGGRFAQVPTYLHIYPEDHPGAQAPLGWSLSEAAQQDLDKQLARTQNQCSVLAARAWLTQHVGSLSCAAQRATDDPVPNSAYAVCFGVAKCEPAPAPLEPCAVITDANQACRADTDSSGVVRLMVQHDQPGKWGTDIVFGPAVAEPAGTSVASGLALWICIAASALVIALAARSATRKDSERRQAVRALFERTTSS